MPEVQEPPKTEQTDNYTDPNTELASLMSPPPVEEAPPEPQDAPPVEQEPPKNESGEVEEGQTTPEGEKPVTDDKKGPGRPPGTAKELRQALDSYKKEVAQLKSELQKTKSVKMDDPEKKTLLEKLQTIEKQKSEMEGELKLANFRKTPEFKEKFLQPLEKAFESAYDDVKQLSIETDTGESRMATEADFNRLMELPLNQAIKQAKEWFGDASNLVIASRQRIIDLQKNSRQAIEKYQKEAEEREKLFHVEQQQQIEKANQVWESTISEQIEKFPNFFAPVEGDEELNAVIERDTKTVDLVFTGQAKNLPLEQKVKLEATIRNKAIGFGKLAVENKRLNQKIADLEKKLAAYSKSTPGGGVPQTDKAKDDSWQGELKSAYSK